MQDLPTVKYYSSLEENLNIGSHAFGLVLSIVALSLLMMRANVDGDIWHIISFGVFGLSLIFLYAASTAYHLSREPVLRAKLRVIDHVAIYILIAGTYTPFALITLHGSVGWTIFGVSWTMALIGIILKIFFTGRYALVSTLLYVLMGWIIVFAVKPLMENLSPEGISWLVIGGLAYTIGAILYSIKKIKFNHAIFHLLVLVGSLSHFIAVYLYIS